MDTLVQIEWNWMSEVEKAVVLTAYHWGDSVGYRELGAHYAHESRGRMRSVRVESDGTKCAGAGQVNVNHATRRTYDEGYSDREYRRCLFRLTTDLNYSLDQSWQHIKIGLKMFNYRWNVYRWYNNVEANNHGYAAWIVAWTRFLDKIVADSESGEKCLE